jgi:hypothetical protein
VGGRPLNYALEVMISKLALALSLLSIAGQAGATCLVEPVEKQVASADTVFIATILSATVEDPDKNLRHDKFYRVTYTFEVRKVIKGDPSRVSVLFSERLYSDPLSSERVTMGEDWPISPGDSVVVVANRPGPAIPGSCGKTTYDFVKYAREHDL